MEEKIVKVLNEMSAYLTIAQMKKLQEIMLDTFAENKIEKSNVANNDFLQMFLDAKKIEGCSGRTIQYYQTTILHMFSKMNVPIRKITTEEIRAYLSEYQENSHCTNVTVDNIRRNISSFFSWLEEEDYILKSPMKRIHKIKTKTVVKSVISDEGIEKLRDYCTESRDLAIIDLLYSTGIRVVQPLDNNDNTGEKNELASLIGNFNPTWDAEGSNDEAFFQAVSVAGMILENKFDRYRGNERADKRVEEIYERHMQAFHDREKHCEDAKILILPEFVPCQKFLSETSIAFVIFPSNRGGYCIQPQKKEYSMNYKCSFPSEWLGLENEELQEVTGLKTAGFCHKGGFLMTTGELADAVQACKISMEQFHEKPVIVSFGGDTEYDELIHQLPKLQAAEIIHIDFPTLPEVEIQGVYAEVTMEKQEWKSRVKEQVKQILKYKPEAVFVGENLFAAYPIVHALRKKHIPVFGLAEKDGQKLIVRIPSGS